MKNIHILPTDKPSNLLLCIKDYIEHKNTPAENFDKKGNFRLGFGKYTNTEFYQFKNIYITSDEEIKEGDWIYDSSENDVIKRSNFPDINGYIKRFCKKIILTTDQDLIKDGVQAINDEFLEWFVKNPTCESVEIDIQRIFGRSSPLDTLGQTFITYKITNYEKFYDNYTLGIEEPKQELPKTQIDWSGFPKSTQKQVGFTEPNIIDDWLDKNADFEITKQVEEEAEEFCKQETLEEAFERINKEIDYQEFDFPSFGIGAKWQQEQNKNKYSEEEVHKIIGSYQAHLTAFNTNFTYNKWFEQNKKK